MAFHEQGFQSRYHKMGDEAEAQFEAEYENGWERFGLSRPNLSVSMLPMMVRHAPDYITSHGFVEVVGVGRDRILKMKVDKAIALQQWHCIFNVRLYVWDSKRKRSMTLDWDQFWPTLPTYPIELFSEGKPYWAVQVDGLG